MPVTVKRGVARGTAFLATERVLQAMAVRGLQSGQSEAALEQSYLRWKFEPRVCFAMLACVVMCDTSGRANRRAVMLESGLQLFQLA